MQKSPRGHCQVLPQAAIRGNAAAWLERPTGTGTAPAEGNLPGQGTEAPSATTIGRRAKCPISIKGRGKRKGAWEPLFSCNVCFLLGNINFHKEINCH